MKINNFSDHFHLQKDFHKSSKMTYPIGSYPRGQAPQMPHPMQPGRIYNPNMYPQPAPYYYHPNQPYIQIPQNIPPYPVMQYPQGSNQISYVQDNSYMQQMKMPPPPTQQTPVRYPQPQPTYQAHIKEKPKQITPIPQQIAPTIPQRPPQQQYQPKPVVAPPPQPVAPSTPPKPAVTPQVNNLDQLQLNKSLTSSAIKISSVPPGCFHIIGRGNLPGIIFSNIVV